MQYMAEVEPADEPAMEPSSAASRIDNQAYLREFEERRRSRASGRFSSTAEVIIEKRYHGFAFPPQARVPPRCGGKRTTFFNYQNGVSSIRYYDGYWLDRYSGSQLTPCGPRLRDHLLSPDPP